MAWLLSQWSFHLPGNWRQTQAFLSALSYRKVMLSLPELILPPFNVELGVEPVIAWLAYEGVYETTLGAIATGGSIIEELPGINCGSTEGSKANGSGSGPGSGKPLLLAGDEELRACRVFTVSLLSRLLASYSHQLVDRGATSVTTSCTGDGEDSSKGFDGK